MNFKVFFFLIFLFSSPTAWTQTYQLYNSNLKDTSKMLVYMVVPNQIKIANYNTKDLFEVQIDKQARKRLDRSGILVSPINNPINIKLWVNKKLYNTYTFQHAQLSSPQLSICKGKDTILSVAAWSEIGHLEVTTDDEYQMNYKIISYEIEFILGGKPLKIVEGADSSRIDSIIMVDPISGEESILVQRGEQRDLDAKIYGGQIPQLYQTFIKRLKAGDQIRIFNITCVSAEGSIRKLNDCYITIK